MATTIRQGVNSPFSLMRMRPCVWLNQSLPQLVQGCSEEVTVEMGEAQWQQGRRWASLEGCRGREAAEGVQGIIKEGKDGMGGGGILG